MLPKTAAQNGVLTVQYSTTVWPAEECTHSMDQQGGTWTNYPAEKYKTTLLLKYEGLYLDIKVGNSLTNKQRHDHDIDSENFPYTKTIPKQRERNL